MPFCESLIPQSPEIQIEGLKLSHEADYVAVSQSNHTVEIYDQSQGEWSLLGSFKDNTTLSVPLGKVMAMIWHPYLPRRLLVGFSNGIIHFIAFEHYEGMHGIISEKKIDIRSQFLEGTCRGIDCLSQNDAATEFSALLDKKIFTYRSKPIRNAFRSAALYNVIPSRLTCFRENKPITLCYVQEAMIIGVYPLGILYVSSWSSAVSTFYPNTVSWVLDILPARWISSAAISPDKKLCIGITSYGEADLYSLDKQTFLAKVLHFLGPFRSISTAIFYNWRCVALTLQDGPFVKTISSLRVGSDDECKTFRMNGDILVPLHSLDSTSIEGRGRIMFVSGQNNMIISIEPESFSGNNICINLVDTDHRTEMSEADETENEPDSNASVSFAVAI